MTIKNKRKIKRILHKIWGVILVILIPINGVSLIFMACCLDSETPIPAIIGLINALYLLCIVIANDPERNERRRKKSNGIDYKKDKDKELQRRVG